MGFCLEGWGLSVSVGARADHLRYPGLVDSKDIKQTCGAYVTQNRSRTTEVSGHAGVHGLFGGEGGATSLAGSAVLAVPLWSHVDMQQCKQPMLQRSACSSCRLSSNSTEWHCQAGSSTSPATAVAHTQKSVQHQNVKLPSEPCHCSSHCCCCCCPCCCLPTRVCSHPGQW